jgi:methyltransferase (TIGR00027 family)
VKQGEASRTAEFNALFRALESSSRPRSKRLFEDHLARGFLGRSGYVLFLLSRLPLAGRIVPWYIDRKWPGVRPSAIGRTCWIDDRLRAAIEGGIRQIVILGAGYDCRAYRLRGVGKSRVYELDHPSTLSAKVKCLKRLLGTIPENVTFIEVDFSRQDFAGALDRSGFDRAIPTFFLWEGVMHYLTAEAVDVTLRSIRTLSAPGSSLVFTYVHRGLLDGSVVFEGMGNVPATLKESGENWTFGLHPGEISAYLSARGFALVTDIGSREIRSHYMGASGSHLEGFEFYRAALAEACYHPVEGH